MLRAVSPQFLVDDLAAAIAFYEERLGFRRDFVYEGFYASVSRDGARIHLKCAPKLAGEREHRAAGEHLDAFVEVGDVRALYDEIVRRGALIASPLTTQAWGRVEFVVRDLDGHRLCFSQPA